MKGRSVIYFKEMAHAVTESGKAAGRGQQAGDTSRATVAVVAWRPSAHSISSSLGEAGLCSPKVFT